MSQQFNPSPRYTRVRRSNRLLTVLAALLVAIGVSRADAQCKVVYTISPQNSSTFGAAISIQNTGSTTLSNWTLTWSFANGQTISGSWNGVVTQSGANVTVSEQTGQTWENIPAGGSYTGFGFNGTWNGVTNAIPTNFAVNGTACNTSLTATTTTLAASSTTVATGTSITLTATVAPSTAAGTVTFLDGTTSLGTGTLSSGKATLSTSFSTAGTHPITAVYGGSTTFATSTSSAVSIAVTSTKTPTTTALVASTTTPAVGASVTLTATVSPSTATGTVTFMSGTTSLGTGTLSSGVATLATSFATAGTDSLTAIYAGSTTFATSTSSAVSITVGTTKTATTTALAVSNTTPVVGASVTLTATVSPSTATGTVTFMSGTTSLGTGTLSSGVATLTTSFATAGPISLTAVYGGSTTFATSTSSAISITVGTATKTPTTTTLAASTTTPTVGASVTLTATVSPSTATGTVTFMSGTTSLGTGTLSSGVATLATSFATAGPVSLTAAYGGSTTFATSTSSALSITVSTGNAGMACNVIYTITPQSSSAFGATIALDNTGTTNWTSWTLQWTFANGQTISSLWNGIETQTGALVTVTNESYNGSVPAGGSVTNIGFNGNLVGGNAVPTAFSVNGTLCGALSGAPPLAPTGLTATPGSAQIALAWTPSLTATSYNVLRSTTNGGPYTTVGTSTTTSFTNTGLTNGTIYYYVVAAVNTAGAGADSTQVFAEPGAVAPNVTVIVNPAQTQAISPYIYGINGNTNASIPNAPDVTVLRMGGNRWTAYNWTTNASNAGSDFEYESDNFLTSSTIPGFAVYPSINANIAAGEATLFTVPMQGLVSADESGPVPTANAPDLARFQTIVDQKSTVSSAPFTTTPPIVVVSGEDTGNVYSDEFVWAMNQLSTTKELFSGTTSTPAFVDIDNEPDLWNSTHLEVQGATEITPAAYIAKTLTMTEALKTQFPNMIIFGPSHYGFLGVYNFQGGVTGTTPTGENWFTDEYFQALSTASATFGKPLVDVYDFHWYPEDYDAGSTRVTSLTAATLSDADMQLIVQAPRNLWDPTFTDPGNSNPWPNSVLGGAPIQFLPRLQAKIKAEFPSIKLSISEYETGGFNNIAGTVAQADQLGVYASNGLFAGMLWPPSGTYDYELAGFRAYRNFDGAGSNFGDELVQTTSSNPGAVTVYVSTDTTTSGRVVMVAINRANTSQVAAITGMTLSGTASLYQMTATTAQGQSPVKPVSIGTQAVSGSTLTLTLPAYSVTTINIP
ncbi:MAG: Ig-like domain repeat protein [Terracidiphilus sp.]